MLASTLILNVPNRINWKSCVATKDEETKAALEMRKNFKPFDFTIDDEDDDD